MFQEATPSSPPLDRAGDVLPRFGMGTAAIGNLYRAIDDATADATVAAALDAGVRYFDTARVH